jgi:hypothetical protein
VSKKAVALLFAMYLLVVVALPLTLGIVVTYRGLNRDRRCPTCDHETIRITSFFNHKLQRLWPDHSLQRRWCPSCGWEGYARVGPPALLPGLEVVRTTQIRPTHGCRTEPLRSLRFGGNQWRVLLQCWQEQGSHYGRLLFVGPAGRLWRDATEPFAGPTRIAVVEQALSLSDGLLTYRLRALVE